MPDNAFHFVQAELVRDAFRRYEVRYLFLGKAGAILLGYSDTTQDADVFIDNQPTNNQQLLLALRELGFSLTQEEKEEVLRGKDFIQLLDGPFVLDLVFAPDGIERFDDAWQRRVEVEGFMVCSLDDIIRSKEAAGRTKDRESLPRLKKFREWLSQRGQ